MRADTPTGPVEGTAEGITADGFLLVRPDGQENGLVSVAAGDVTHLKSV